MLRNDSNLLIVWEPYLPALTIVSCAFSVIGSVSIMASYCVWKDTRSLSRLILVIIALSDLVTASGYIIGSALYLNISSAATENGTDYLQLQDTQPFQTLCMIQSAITTISNMWSFWWMAILAIHLCLIAGYMKKELSEKLLPFAALLATCVPVVVTIPAAVTGWLGPGNGTASVSWCFIGLPDKHTRDATYDALEFVEGKMWEFISFALILVLVSFLKCRLNKHRKDAESNPLLHKAVNSVSRHTENRLLAFPIVFFFIRLWGTIRYVLSWSYVLAGYKNTDTVNFIVDNIQNSTFLLSMQAIFDGSQGWVNALLFLILSRKGIVMMSSFCLKLKLCSLLCWYRRSNSPPSVADNTSCNLELTDSGS